MGDETKILFTDTNGFLQVKDLKDIAWKDLFPGATCVDVMVAPSVIDELDKHKTGTNQRRRDRARFALKLIDQASRSLDLTLVLRDKPICVRMVISTAPRLNWTQHPNLDPANADDQLVAEALSFGNGAAIFSYDTGPRIRARIAKIEAYEPAEDWLLPIEQTDDQRKITQLERDLKQSLSRFPNIVAGFDNLDEETSEIRIIRPVPEPLDPELVLRLTADYLAMHPRANPHSTGHPWLSTITMYGISDHQVEKYHADYSSFEARVHDYYANLHELVRRLGTVATIDYWVKNDSGVAADGLRIEFDLEGVGSLVSDREDAAPYLGCSMKILGPPELPRSDLDRISNIALGQLVEPPRDPVAFYWFKRPEIVAAHGAKQCQEFRPTRVFRDSILVLAPPRRFARHARSSSTRRGRKPPRARKYCCESYCCRTGN
jgi:hypothetical protein